MKTLSTWGRIAGVVLHVLIGGLLLLSGGAKAFGLAPESLLSKLNEYGLGGNAGLIGWGEMLAGTLLIVPRTLSLGVLLVSGFWGGVICILMAHKEDYTFSAILLLLTWLGAWIRMPALMSSFGLSGGRPRSIGPGAVL